MSEATNVCERGLANAVLEELGKSLHNLCQPLTTLQCRLELAGVVGTMEAYREAVDVGLAECSRLMESVASMRAILQAARLDSGEEASRGSG
jgi:hypothetical protein